MDEIFKPGAVDVVKFVRRYNFDVSHQESRIELRVGDTLGYIAACHAYFVQYVAIGGDRGKIGLAPQT